MDREKIDFFIVYTSYIILMITYKYLRVRYLSLDDELYIIQYYCNYLSGSYHNVEIYMNKYMYT